MTGPGGSLRHLPGYLGAGIVLFMGALQAYRIFPDRRFGIAVVLLSIIIAVVRSFRSGSDAVGWFCIVIGLNSPPFCELHVERDIWGLIASLVLFFLVFRKDGMEISIPDIRIFALYGAFCLWSLIVCVSSVYPHAALKQAVLFVFYGLLFLAGTALLDSESRRRIPEDMIMMILSSHILFAVWAMLDRVAHLGWREGFGFRWFVYHRHPNYVIFPLLIGIPFLLGILTSDSSLRRRRTAAGILLGSVMYLLTGSFSRTGLIVLLVYMMIGMMWVQKKLTRKMRYRILGLLILVVVVGVSLNTKMVSRLTSFAYLNLDPRLRAWEAFIDLAADRPVSGYGLGTNRYIFPQAWAFLFPLEPPTRQFLVEAHNAYLDILAGTGWPGLLLFTGFLFLMLRRVIRSKEPGFPHILMMTVGLIIDLGFSFRFHAHDTGTWLMVFMIWILVQTGTDAVHRCRISTYAFRFGSFAVVLLAAAPYMGEVCSAKARALLPQGDWPSIGRWYRAAASIEPLNAHPWYYLSLCADQERRPADALLNLKVAVELCPNYAFYRHLLAQSLMRLNRTELATEQAEIAVDLEPFDAEAKYRITASVLNQIVTNFDRSDLHAAIAVSVNPGIAADSVLRNSGVDLQKLVVENFANVDYLTEYRELPQNFLFFSRSLLKSFESFIPPDELIQWCHQLVTLVPSLEAGTGVVSYLIHAGQYAEAEKVLYRLMVRFGEEPTLLLHLAYISYKNDDLEMAGFLVDRANRRWRHLSLDNLIGYKMAAAILERLGKPEESAEYQQKIAWLEGGELDRQKRDLTIHTGGRDSALYDLDQLFVGTP